MPIASDEDEVDREGEAPFGFGTLYSGARLGGSLTLRFALP